jgi:hypothetical protein
VLGRDVDRGISRRRTRRCSRHATAPRRRRSSLGEPGRLRNLLVIGQDRLVVSSKHARSALMNFGGAGRRTNSHSESSRASK